MVAVEYEIAQELLAHTANGVWADKLLETKLAALMKKMGRPLNKRDCLICISDSLKILQSESIKYEMMNGKSELYKLKHNVTFSIGFRVSNDNLTDDMARKFLYGHPERLTLFSKYPQNWEEDVKPNKAAKKSKKDEPTK